jgi:NTE family protein
MPLSRQTTGWRSAFFSKCLFVSAAFLAISACSTTSVPVNQPFTVADEQSGYRRLNATRPENVGETLLLLSFSGGGTRAAALSYGVMQELRDTLITIEDQESRVLDTVDSISSVSGGSFTAAYYGLFRDQLFEDYEDTFLRRDVQQSLINKLLSPVHWARSTFTGYDRTDMAVDYYDKNIFHGATFDDLGKQGPPFIGINATDLALGMRFTFSQERFDLICSDLGSFPVARAVAASSAVPGVFPTIVLKNHADQCDLSETRGWQLLENASKTAEWESQESATRDLMSYRDGETRQYIHLVDGGISDNLGLRPIIDRLYNMNDYQIELLKEKAPRDIVIILVNAEVTRERGIEQSAKNPSLSKTVSTLTNTQMIRYNQETLDRLKDGIEVFERRASNAGIQTNIYFSEVGFDIVHRTEISRFLNSVPTSLNLDDDNVDKMIAAGRLLLRHEPSFQRFKTSNKARLADGAVTDDEMCQQFGYDSCQLAREAD